MSASAQPFLKLYRPDWRTRLYLLATLLLALILMRLDAFTHLTTHIVGGVRGDGGLYVWLSRHATSGFFSYPWFETSAFYPYGKTLAWSDSYLLPGFICGLLGALGCSLTVAYNLTLLSAIACNGYCTALAGYLFTGNARAAFFSGLLAITSLPLAALLGHPQLQWFFYLPVALLIYFSYLERPRWSMSLSLGATFFAAYISSVYIAFFIPLALGAVTVALLTMHPGMLRAMRPAVLLTGGVIGALPVLPFALPYVTVQQTFGERHLYELAYFAATARSYIAASEWSMIFGGLAHYASAEDFLFPGITISLLVLIQSIRLCQSRRLVQSAVALVLVIAATMLCLDLWISAVGLWLALGFGLLHLYRLRRLESSLGVQYCTNRDLIGALLFAALVSFALSFGALSLTMVHPFTPGALLFQLIPGYSGLRAASRFGLLIPFFFALIAAFCIAKTTLSNRIFSLFCLLVCAEGFLNQFPIEPLPRTPDIVKDIPLYSAPDDVWLAVPYAPSVEKNWRIDSWTEFAAWNVPVMLWAQDSGRKTINGYSGQQTKMMRELPRDLQQFPDRRSLTALKQIAGMRLVAVFPEMYSESERPALLERLKNLPEGFSMRELSADGHFLIELTGASAPLTSFTISSPALRSECIIRFLPPESPTEVAISDEEQREVWKGTLHPGTDPQSIAIPLNPQNFVRPVSLSIRSLNPIRLLDVK